MATENKRHKKLQIVLISLAVVALIISLVLFFQTGPKVIQEPSGSYSLSSNLYLQDKLSNNTLYGNGTTLTNPSIVYVSITSNLSLDWQVSYTNSVKNSTAVDYSYYVYLISSSPSWKDETYHFSGSRTASGSAQFSMDLPINVSSNISKGEYINSQLGAPTGSGYSLEFVAVVNSPLGTSNSTITMSIGYPTYSVTGPTDNPISGTYSKYVYLPGQQILKLPAEYGYVFLATAISLFFLGFIVNPPEKTPVLEKFRRANSDNLVELTVGPPEGAIKVKGTEEVFKMAAFVERPVFLYENLIYIEVDGKAYYAEIGE